MVGAKKVPQQAVTPFDSATAISCDSNSEPSLEPGFIAIRGPAYISMAILGAVSKRFIIHSTSVVHSPGFEGFAFIRPATRRFRNPGYPES
jgi:hypothetical protein